ncbi:MAG: glutamate-5-semialdehyde dehydrogenase [Treponema sp.]|nr:glutamate-5-semialdehyde dehydrogenase [Treponema sp.]
MDIDAVCQRLRAGADKLAMHTASQKNHALECVKDALLKSRDLILSANAKDVEASREAGVSEALVERLALDARKFTSILQALDVVIGQNDPIGEEIAGWKAPKGMQIRQVRVPLGVVGIIYESRPNVTVDAFALAYKSGNAILLRGSSSALNSNKAIVSAIAHGLSQAGSDGVRDAICLCEDGSHDDVEQMLGAVGKIDVLLPRGSSRLINAVVEKARVPVIQTGAGVCHLYVDDEADISMAVNLTRNSKMQRPGACNAIETLLVNKRIAGEFLPALARALEGKVRLLADEISYPLLLETLRKGGILDQNGECLDRASKDDFGFEFLDFTLAVKCVGSVEEAVEFINAHNTKHSECIVTNNRWNARYFQSRVDAACVYVNASTRFTDGGEFGFGAELGISTQKLHARGPMGITALTTTKFLIDGDGQVR